MTTDNTDISNNPPRDYNNSRLLDVHIWSDYPEVNEFINVIYDAYFRQLSGKINITKKHIKIVLLDLYVAWLTDLDLNIAVNMTRDFYSKNFGTNTTRYNELNISAKTITVIHTLVDEGLVGYKQGVEAQEGYGRGFVSRIWAKPTLVRMFEKSALQEFMIYSHHNREVLIMRDENKDDIEYLHYVHISHKGKFTHRVFNNSSWSESGRFYGGFWQRIGEGYREKILINDEETVELDFSSLHPVLAYAKKGVDYWKEYKVSPYNIPVEGIDDRAAAREVIKKLFLLALNAKNDGELFKAFRSEFDYSLLGSVKYKFTDDALGKMLDSIKEKHPIIVDQIATGAGTVLMNLDGRIVEFVIKRFLTSNTPVLSVHDSFIVQTSQRDRLQTAMKDAWVFVTEQTEIKYKQNVPIYQDAVAWRHLDRDFYLDRMEDLKSAKRTTGYLNRLNKHNKFFNPKPAKSKAVQYTLDEIVMPKRYKKYKQ